MDYDCFVHVSIVSFLISRRNPPAVRPLPDNPTFPELVFYYLPEPEWMSTASNGLGFSHAMGERQRLLLLNTSCSREHILVAWRDWEGLLGFRQSERQRMCLMMTTMQWGIQWKLYREITTGLYGSQEEQKRFTEKWMA